MSLNSKWPQFFAKEDIIKYDAEDDLAADRLKKKYRPDDPEKAEQFDQFLTIISRQVGDIGRLVDEFSTRGMKGKYGFER